MILMTHTDQWTPGPADSDPDEQCTVVIHLLGSLYRLKHRLSTLTALMNLDLDGAQFDEFTMVSDPLWDTDHEKMLEVADGSRFGINSLESTLIDKLANLPRRRQARFRSGIESLLRRDCHSQNPHIAVSARKLLKELKKDPSNWAKVQQSE